MKVTRRDQLRLMSHVPISMMQAMKIGKIAPILTHLYVLQPSNPELKGQIQEIETTTDLAHKDNSKRTSEPSTNTETTCAPMTQPPLRQSDNPSTPEINDTATEKIPQNEPRLSTAGKNNLRPNVIPNYSDIFRF